MNNNLRKMLGAALSLAMVAGSIVLPTAASADEMKSWKFDFGAKGSTPEAGYTLVTPDIYYYAEDNSNGYGFLGISENSYRESNRLDGFSNQKGQIIRLEAGGGTGLNDAIGSTGSDNFGNAGDEYYPTRFAIKADDETYYKVKATVTTLDPNEDAEVSLYTERKHPIFTDKTITAGGTYTAEFSVRVTPVYYEKSNPKGSFSDGMINVCVLGKNSALASLEVEQVASVPTLWVLGDSTVTDGPGTLPFCRLQNYTGVGTGLTKYLSGDIAMVNEGEGGLAAGDNNHFNMVKTRIKQGDYMYVEYGHNHKSDGPSGYKSCLDKYYDACRAVGATLIIVSPIERINTFSNGAYQHSLRGFAEAGEAYVNEKIAGGATDIAYVDLNKTSLEFYNKIVTDNDNNANAIKFYFQTAKDGETDTTHPNDAGAENLANCFFEAAKAVTNEKQKAALAGLMNNTNNETPNFVPASVIAGGLTDNAAWPTYTLPIDEEYPANIRSIDFDEEGHVVKAKVKVQQAKTAMTSYGIIVITIKNAEGNETGKLYAVDQVDNSTGYGSQMIENFRGEALLEEGGTYSAVVMKGLDTPDGLVVDEEANTAYSREFTAEDASEIDEYIIPGELTDVEDFDHFAQTKLTGSGKWLSNGSNGFDLSLGKEEDGRTYTTLAALGTGGSWCVAREFENLTEINEKDEVINVGTGNTGRIMIDCDIKYVSGSNLIFLFAEKTVKNFASPFIDGARLDAFTIGSEGTVMAGGKTLAQKISSTDWTHLNYILDMDAGTAQITIGDAAPETIALSDFATFEDLSVSTFRHLAMTSAVNQAKFNVKLSNLTVAKLRESGAKTTMKVGIDADGNGSGSVYINEAGNTELSVPQSTKIKIYAVPGEGSKLTGWYNTDGSLFSTDKEIPLRLYKDLDLKAKFEIGVPATVTVNYKDADGNTIKPSDTITELNGRPLYTNEKFDLDSGYKDIISIKNAKTYDVYIFNSAKTVSTTINALEESNTINLVFDHDGTYNQFEDFSKANDTWGFTEGRKDSVAVVNDELGLLQTNDARRLHNDTKTFDSAVSSAKVLTLKFDWRSTVESGKGRHSTINLKDGDNYIFSLHANGAKGIYYKVNGVASDSASKVTGDVNDVYLVDLSINFINSAVSGKITNKTTGAVTVITETPITGAKSLKTFAAEEASSLAPMFIDNFRYKDDTPSALTVGTPALNGNNVELNITNNTQEEAPVRLVVISYGESGIVEKIALSGASGVAGGQSVTLIAEKPATDDYKIMLWDRISDMKPLMDAVTKLN